MNHRCKPELPTATEIVQVKRLLDRIESDGYEVESYRISAVNHSPWLEIDVALFMHPPEAPCQYALWRTTGAVHALDEGAVIEDAVFPSWSSALESNET